MTILVDIGNTRLKYCQASNLNNIQYFEHKTTVIDHDWLSQHWGKCSNIIIASVKLAKLHQHIITWAEQHHISVTTVKNTSPALGVKSGYNIPSQLGVDRWLALIATASLFPAQHCLIIDTGTATTIDILAADKQHMGGWILPGINMMYDSLLNDTDMTFSGVSSPSTDFANNTVSNIIHGSFAATIGAIELALKQAKHENNEIKQIILTGGNAHTLSPLLDVHHIIVPELVFIGMQQFLNKKTPNK